MSVVQGSVQKRIVRHHEQQHFLTEKKEREISDKQESLVLSEHYVC
jgi:hypothetical protein